MFTPATTNDIKNEEILNAITGTRHGVTYGDICNAVSNKYGVSDGLLELLKQGLIVRSDSGRYKVKVKNDETL